MEHQEIKNLLPLAALDRLDPGEAQALQEHLRARCAECEAELRELRETAAALALSAGQEGSEARVWERLAERMRRETAGSPRSAGRPAASRRAPQRVGVWRGAAALLAACVAGLAIYAGYLNDRLRRANRDSRQFAARMDSQMAQLRAGLTRAREETASLQRVLGERIRLEKVLTAPDLRLTRLAPLAPAPGAGAVVAVSAANRTAVLQASGLPATPAGKTYELWWITRESGPVAAGLFQAEKGRPVIASVSVPPAGQHVLLSAVTLEPAGGVSKPTGAMFLKGAPGPV